MSKLLSGLNTNNAKILLSGFLIGEMQCALWLWNTPKTNSQFDVKERAYFREKFHSKALSSKERELFEMRTIVIIRLIKSLSNCHVASYYYFSFLFSNSSMFLYVQFFNIFHLRLRGRSRQTSDHGSTIKP